MTSRDEPLGEPDEPTSATRSEALVTSIRRLVTGEAYAVPCTRGYTHYVQRTSPFVLWPPTRPTS